MISKKFVSKLFIFLITFVVFSVSKVFSADFRVDFLLSPDLMKSDKKICAFLSAKGIENPCEYWREHVTEKLAAIVTRANVEEQSFWRNTMLRFMGEIKENLLAGREEEAQRQIDALKVGIPRFAMLPLPLPLQDKLDQKAKFLTEVQRADLVFKIKVMLDEGINWKSINEYLSEHLCRLRFLAGQKGSSAAIQRESIGGLMPWQNSVSEIPARIVDPLTYTSRLSPMQFRARRRNEWQKITDITAAAQVIGSIRCSCNQIFVPEGIVRELNIILADDLNSVRLDFSLQLPRCPGCSKPTDNFRELRNVLPVQKRKAVVLRALVQALEQIPEEILVLLLATNPAYFEIITHSPHGNILPKTYLAQQIFECDERMKHGITAPFSSGAVWVR